MAKHKRTVACAFPQKVRERIKERDGGCIFCKREMKYGLKQMTATDIMHIVPRSAGGLGIEENGVFGCRFHHHLLDNGSNGERQEMMSYITWYMMGLYPGWNREKLIYRKEFT